MPVMTVECGCTLDTDFVDKEHRKDGPPWHIVLKGNVQPYVPAIGPEPEAEPEAEPFEELEDKPKKKR